MIDFNFPLHWNKLMLFQVATEQKISNKNVHHQNLLSLSYGHIKRKDINTNGGLLPTSFDTYQIVNAGNVILRLTDLQNDHKSLRVGLVTETGIITSAYTCLKARENILPQFLYLILHTYDLNKIFYGMGGGVRQSIGYSDIRKMTIALPTINEQKKIIRYLDKKTTQIATYIKAKKKEIELLDELKRSIISDTVTKGLHSLQMPVHWKKIKLKYLFEIKNGATPSSFNPDYWNGKITWITPADFIPKQSYIFKSKRTISEEGLNSCGTHLVPKNSIIISTRAPIGSVALAGVNLCTNQGCKSLVKKNNNINSQFFYYHFLTQAEKLNAMGRGTTFLELSTFTLRNIKIPIPPLEEQKEISNFLDTKCAKIEKLIEALKDEIKFAEELKTRIISDVVTGKIDVRELI